MRKTISGFTIVELLIVIILIGILSTISIMSFSRVQASSRDTERSSKINILAEALEKYYDQNGEYPSCTAMSQPADVIISDVLKGTNADTLRAPSANSGTNSILASCGNLALGNDAISYIGDGSSTCLTGQNCVEWTLKYYNEETNSIKTVSSRRKAKLGYTTNITAIANSSSQITVSWDSVANASSYALEYSLNSNFASSSYINGINNTSQAVTGLENGRIYYFRVYAIESSTTGPSSPSISVSTLINTPTVPTVAKQTNDTSSTIWSWNTITCPTDATVRYQYRFTISPSGYDSGLIGINITTLTLTTSSELYTYTLQVQSQCYNSKTASSWSSVGQSVYYRPKAWKQISVGDIYSCGIASDDLAYCWSNYFTTTVPVSTAGLLSGKTIKLIASGKNQVCVIASDNLAYCWGSNTYGQLGNNLTVNSDVPVAVNVTGVLNGKTFKSISAGYYATCAIASDNLAYCWGSNMFLQLGNNLTADSLVPVAVYTSGVLSGKTILSMSSRDSGHTCVIASDNQTYCWGNGVSGQLGNNIAASSKVPVAVYTSGVLSGKTISSISNGMFHTCAIANDSQLYCWGLDTSGQLGNNLTVNSPVPVAVINTGALAGKTISSVSNGADFTCAIASDKRLYCWGSNTMAQFGNNTSVSSSVPVPIYDSGVLSGKTINSVSSGNNHSCAIASDSQAYCWGDSGYTVPILAAPAP